MHQITLIAPKEFSSFWAALQKAVVFHRSLSKDTTESPLNGYKTLHENISCQLRTNERDIGATRIHTVCSIHS